MGKRMEINFLLNIINPDGMEEVKVELKLMMFQKLGKLGKQLKK